MSSAASLDDLYVAHLATLASRTASALSAEGFDGLVIHSGTPRAAFLDDQNYPFRVNPHFKWWLPLLDAPDCLLYVQPGRRPRLALNAAPDYWHKPPSLPSQGWTSQIDVCTVGSREAACAALPCTGSRTAFLGEPFSGLNDLGYAAINPQRLLDRLHEQRVRKTPYEVQCLREASVLGARGHVAAAAAFAAGGSEFAIHQAFLNACGLREQELPYQAIIALNEHAATLHYQELGRSAPHTHRSLLIDAGAHFRGYASDITRSHAGSDGDYAALLTGMDDLQQTLAAAVRAGIDWRHLHLSAHLLVAELLRDAGIIKLEPADAVDSGLSGVFLPHGLGHLLGLQVHDVAGLRPEPLGPPVPAPTGHESLRLTRVLEPGFVVTMEPGIYFIDMLLQAARSGRHGQAINWPGVDALRPYGGIRIEDNLLVNLTGHQNLTREAFARAGAQQTSPV